MKFMAVGFVMPRFIPQSLLLSREGRGLRANGLELRGSRAREAPLGAACRLGSPGEQRDQDRRQGPPWLWPHLLLKGTGNRQPGEITDI